MITLGVVLTGAPMTAMAQQPAKVFRIGILSPAAAASTKAFDALRNGLRELGYIEGAKHHDRVSPRCLGLSPIAGDGG
jgi:hypothetical protein